MSPTDTAEAKAPRGRVKHPALFWAAAALVLLLDQATKELVRSLLERGAAWPDADWAIRIQYVTNTGAAFGVLRDQTAFLIVTTFIGLAAIYLYYRNPPSDHFVVSAAVGMMLGGAVGNLVDRVRLGRVTDFIDFPMWPAFNVADASIFIGIAVILVSYALLPPPAARGSPAREEP